MDFMGSSRLDSLPSPYLDVVVRQDGVAVTEPVPRRRFLQRIVLALGGFVAGIGVARVGMAQGPPETFDFWRDAPVDMVIPYDGSLSAHDNLPLGASPKWDVIGIDRALLGADPDAGDVDTEGGTESLSSEIVHLGTAVGNHVVTQPNAHADHVSAGAHTHNAHTTGVLANINVSAVLTGPVTHSSDGGHTHDAHSLHSGTAVDAHVVTQPGIHAIKKFHRSYLLKKVVV